MNKFFVEYLKMSEHARKELSLSRETVLHLNSINNNIRHRSLGRNISLSLFASITIVFFVAIFHFDIKQHITEIQSQIATFISLFPAGFLKEFSKTVLVVFLVSVPGIIAIKFFAWLFFRKTKNWLVEFLVRTRLGSLYFLIWAMLLLNLGPILVMASFSISSVQTSMTEMLVNTLFFELCGIIGILSGLFLRLMTALSETPIEQLTLEFFRVIGKLEKIDLADSDSVLFAEYKLLALADRVDKVRFGSIKQVASRLRLYARWLEVPYSDTPLEIRNRLLPISSSFARGTLASIPHDETKEVALKESPWRTTILPVFSFLGFLAIPMGGLIVLAATAQVDGIADTLKLILTIFFVIWSFIGAFIFIRRSIPELFDFLREILNGFGK